MPGPDQKDEKKKIDDAKKTIQTEVKKLAKKTKKQAEEARELVKEKAEAKKGKATPAVKKRVKEIDLRLKKLHVTCSKEADATSKRISKMLQTQAPDDKKALPLWQKGMDKWYVDILNKEPGFDIGGGARVNGDISFKKKEAKIDFTWKF